MIQAGVKGGASFSGGKKVRVQYRNPKGKKETALVEERIVRSQDTPLKRKKRHL
jgi:hypothetical protein